MQGQWKWDIPRRLTFHIICNLVQSPIKSDFFMDLNIIWFDFDGIFLEKQGVASGKSF